MSGISMGGDTSATAPAVPPSSQPRAARSGVRELMLRFLTLREGSIVVVTLLAIIYFAVKADHFFTHANFITLLPYFTPFAILAAGEGLLMGAGGNDPSVGAGFLFSPFLFYQVKHARRPPV